MPGYHLPPRGCMVAPWHHGTVAPWHHGTVQCSVWDTMGIWVQVLEAVNRSPRRAEGSIRLGQMTGQMEGPLYSMDRGARREWRGQARAQRSDRSVSVLALISGWYLEYIGLEKKPFPFGTIQNCSGPFRTIRDNLGPFGYVWDRFGSCGTVCDRLRLFATSCDRL